MNPVIDLDVCKGESQIQVFLDKRKPYRKSFRIKHGIRGLGNLLEFLHEVEKLASGNQHTVVLESIVHERYSITQFLDKQNYV